MTNEQAAHLNAANCAGLGQQQWGLCPSPVPENVATIRHRLQARADELRKRIASVDADRAELASIEAMLTVDKVDP